MEEARVPTDPSSAYFEIWKCLSSDLASLYRDLGHRMYTLEQDKRDEEDAYRHQIAKLKQEVADLDAATKVKAEEHNRQIDQYMSQVILVNIAFSINCVNCMQVAQLRNEMANRVSGLEQDKSAAETAFREELAKLNMELSARDESICLKETEIRRRSEEQRQLEDKLRDETRSSQNIVRDRDATIAKLKGDLVSSQQHLESVQLRLESQLSATETKLMEVNDKRDDAEAKLDEAVKRIAVLEFAADDYVSKLGVLEEDIESKKSAIQKLASEYDQIVKERDNLSSHIEQLREEHEERLIELNKRKVDELEQRSLEFSMARTSLETKYEEKINQFQLERDQTVAKYQDEVASLKRELTSLNNELTEKLTSLNGELLDCQSTFQSDQERLEQELRLAKETIHVRETELRDTAEQFKTKISAIKDDEKKLRQSKDSAIDGLQQEIRSYEKLLTTMSAQRESDQKANFEEVGLLRSRLEHEATERTQLLINFRSANDKIVAWEGKYTKKCTELDEVRKVADLLEEEKSVLDGECKAVRTMLSESSNEIRELSATLSEIKNRSLDDSKDRSQLVDNMKELRRTLRQVEESRTAIKKELNAERLKVSQLESDLRSQQAETVELTSSLERRREKQTEKQDEIQAIRTKLVEVEAEKRTLRGENSALKVRLNEKEGQLSIKSDSLSGLEAKVTRLQHELNRTESTNRTLNEKHALQRTFFEKEMERSSSKSAMSRTIRASRNNLTANDKDKDGSNVEASTITEGLAALEQEHAKLQDKVASLQSLMNEAEQYSNNGTNVTFDRLKEAQAQAEHLLDAGSRLRSSSASKEVVGIEQEIASLKRHLTSKLSISSTSSSQTASPRKTGLPKTHGLNSFKTSTPIAGHANVLPSNVRGDSDTSVDSSKRRLKL